MPKDAQIVVTGNIKYDRDFSIKPAREAMFFSADDLIFTAGSTREGEEELIAAAYKKVSKAYPAVKFICAPRHINRLPEITALLASQNIPYSLFSKPPYSSNFILVDIFGKLQNIYSISDICFVGGSLVDKGGQNPIEPAAYAKPVIFGKHMDNFKNEKRTLLIYGGALEVSPQNLANSIIALFSNPAKLKDMAQKALYAVKSQGGAVSISIDKIKEMLDES
jgi:3-deoxy-D-manno-octulosonic-acid transferase